MHTFDIDLNNFVNPIIDWLNTTLPNVPSAVIGLLVGILVVRVLVRICRWFFKLTNMQKGLRQLITSAIETFLWLMLTIMFLQSIGFGGIIVFFSSSALAIGILLAAGGSTLLSDIAAGIFLARDHDFNVGDEIKAGENEVQGVIESMDVRRVRIRDKKGRLHVLPNSVVERKEWVVIRRRAELTPLAKAVSVAKVKAATRIKTVAAETKAVVVEKKAAAAEKRAVRLRKIEQQQ